MKLSDIIFDYLPHTADGLSNPFRVLGDPMVRIIDRRLSHTSVGKAEDGEEMETQYHYYVLVWGFDHLGETGSLKWRPEDKVWDDLNEFYISRLCEDE